MADFCPECGCVIENRTSEQNDKLHAMITDIARQKEWAGKKLDVETWKRLLTAAFARAKKQSAVFYPALDGQGFDVVYRRTSRMGKREMSEFIDYVYWYCAENEIEVVA